MTAAGLPASARIAWPSRPWIGLEQAEEEGQVPGVDALFVEREEVLPLGRGQQVVGILDALGHAFQRLGLADVVVGEECVELGIADFGIDRHLSSPLRHAISRHATSRRGSLKTTLSSVVRTSSTVRS